MSLPCCGTVSCAGFSVGYRLFLWRCLLSSGPNQVLLKSPRSSHLLPGVNKNRHTLAPWGSAGAWCRHGRRQEKLSSHGRCTSSPSKAAPDEQVSARRRQSGARVGLWLQPYMVTGQPWASFILGSLFSCVSGIQVSKNFFEL